MKHSCVKWLCLSIIFNVLFVSCDPQWPYAFCNKQVEWLAANESSDDIIVEYVEYLYLRSDTNEFFQWIKQEPYKTFIHTDGDKKRLHVQFLLNGEKEMETYMQLKRGVDVYSPDERISDGMEVVTFVYDLTDTTEFDLYFTDGYIDRYSFTKPIAVRRTDNELRKYHRYRQPERRYRENHELYQPWR